MAFTEDEVTPKIAKEITASVSPVTKLTLRHYFPDLATDRIR